MSKITTFREAQAEAMRRARKGDLSDFAAETLLRRILRQNNIAIPEGMATRQNPEGGSKPKMMYGGMGKKKKMMGGGMSKKRPEMMKGGMANGKKHMYAAGGSVMDGLTPGQKKMVMAMARDNKKA